MPTQSLSNIVSVTVVVSPTAPAAGDLNLGLIVGPSNIISTSTRTKVYSSTSGMDQDGWTGTEPEYKAAEVYFGQNPRPASLVIGRQGTVQTQLTTALTSGTAYTSLAVEALTEDIASGTTITIGTSPTTQTVTSNADAPAGSTTIDVNSFDASSNFSVGTAVSANETVLEAVTACRASNTDWYACYVCGAADTDIEAVAPYIESVTPIADFFYDTQSANVASGTTPNVMSTLQADKYQRTIGMYTAAVEYAGAALMGVAMGLNTGLANSAFTLAYKSLVGITPDDLTTTQVTAIQGWNGNVYTSFGGKYDLFVQGVMADGTPFDQVLNLDTLTVDSQTAVVNALTQSPKIPQTDAGVTVLVDAVATVCAKAKTNGILGPGIWNAAPVLGLQTGTNLPNGYIVLADTIANQSAADVQARKAPPIYACIKLAGAIEHAVIGLIVDL